MEEMYLDNGTNFRAADKETSVRPGENQIIGR